MKKTKIATAEKQSPEVKTEQQVATDVTETKPQKLGSEQKSSNKPKAVSQKPVSEAKAASSVSRQVKPKTASLTQKPSKNEQSATPKPAAKAKAEKPVATVFTEEKPKKPAVKKPTINSKTATLTSVPEPKIEQPVVSNAAGTRPKKASPTQKSLKTAKAGFPNAVAPESKTAQTESANIPLSNVWPNWVENLLVSFGIKK